MKCQSKIEDIDFLIGVIRWLIIFGPMFNDKLNTDALINKMDELLDLRNELEHSRI
jgi:hypothetical protein